MKIIDAWKRMHSGATSYGFVAQIFVPEPVNTGDWSILVRFSPLNTKEMFLIILGVKKNLFHKLIIIKSDKRGISHVCSSRLKV